jgi:hypothetical protein
MKPSARRIERLLAKVEAELARCARPRWYCFHFEPRGMGEEALSAVRKLENRTVTGSRRPRPAYLGRAAPLPRRASSQLRRVR